MEKNACSLGKEFNIPNNVGEVEKKFPKMLLEIYKVVTLAKNLVFIKSTGFLATCQSQKSQQTFTT